MAISLSPAVLVREIDKTNVVPAVATSIGAFAGDFKWGPAEEITTVASENRLLEDFGAPVDGNAKDWFTAANFLAYTADLRIIRALDVAVALNANTLLDPSAGTPVAGAGELVKNETQYTSDGGVSAPVVARYAGVRGNKLTV